MKKEVARKGFLRTALLSSLLSSFLIAITLLISGNPISLPLIIGALLALFVSWLLAYKTSCRNQAQEEFSGESAEWILKNCPLWENMNIGISLVKDRKFIWVNSHFAQIFHKTPDEMNGCSTKIIYKSEEDYQEVGKKAYEALERNQSAEKEIEFQKKDGNVFHGKLTGSILPGGYSIWIAEDKTQQRDFEKKLTSAKEKAEAATRLKSDFMANMSHEIRNPMNGIISMVNLMAHTPLSHEQAGYLETMQLSGENLMRIINDIIDFSKIESGKMKIANKPFEIRKCIESVIDLVYVKAARKKIDLAYFVENKIPETVTGDITRLSQVLLNLTDNAVKYTKSGEVFLQASLRENGMIDFSISDTGSGIPETLVPHLFDRFTRLEAHEEEEGAGLGLAITEKLVELMGGKIKVTTQINKGSTFSFALNFEMHEKEIKINENLKDKKILLAFNNQRRRESLSELFSGLRMKTDIAATEQEAMGKEIEDFDIIFIEKNFAGDSGIKLGRNIRKILHADSPKLILASPSLMPETREREKSDIFDLVIQEPLKHSRLPSLLEKTFIPESRKSEIKDNKHLSTLKRNLPSKHLRILVADDQIINIKIAISILKKLGYEADSAKNGMEVLDALEKNIYDIIFMDCIMPELDGYETAKIISKMNSLQKPRLIAMTADAVSETKTKALDAGMQECLHKPITIDEIEKVILDCLGEIKENSSELPQIDAWEDNAKNPPTLDSFFLEEHMAMDNDILNELFNIFLEETPERIDKLKTAILGNNAPSVREISHGLKGAASTIGAAKFSKLCKKLQKMSESGKTGGEEIIVEVQKTFDETQKAINNKKKSLINSDSL
jgi:PAS domain S-box-containing protein